jgi:flagellin
MTVINTNTASINAQMNLSKVNKTLESAMAQLSSGKRINSAADDAAGMAISSRMTAEITGTAQAVRNASDGQALIDTAEGAHVEVENILQRMRELAVQSSNDTYNSEDRAMLQSEMDQLATEIDRIAQATDWGGMTLLNGASSNAIAASTHSDQKTFNFQIGTNVSAGESVAVKIGAISSQALGLATNDDSSPVLSNVRLTQGSAASTTGVLKADGNTLRLEGGWTDGDVYTVDINDTTLTVTLSNSDGYEDTAQGFAAQLKDTILADAGLSEFMTVTDNGDGSVTLTQTESVVFSSASVTSNAGVDNETITFDGDTVTFDGDLDATDVLAFDINGHTVSITIAADDAWNTTPEGVALQMKDEIEQTAGLEGNVTVVDNGDGSLTITQASVPKIDAIDKTTGTEADPRLEYDAATTAFAFTNATFADGVNYSAQINGVTVSMTSSVDDGFADTITGLGDQWAQAINEANIPGIAATNAAGTVTLAGTVVTADALVAVEATGGTAETSIATTAGYQASATITLTSTDDLSEIGDTFEFSVMGQDFSVAVEDDGYSTILDGLAQRMKDAVDAAGIAGIEVAASNTGTTAVLTVTMVPEVFDVGTSDPELEITQSDGNLVLEGTVASGDEVSLTLGTTAINVTAYSDNKNDLADLLKDAINNAGADFVASVNDDGSIAVSKGSDSASIMSAEAAANAIQNIDAALETINSQRSELGAVSNRMDYTISNLMNVSVNLEGSLSRIQDADFAQVTGELTKAQIMSQAATAMLAQANASKQGVLSLLQG